MHFSIISSPRAAHQLSHQQCLADGLRKNGIEPILLYSHEKVTTKYVACWGWRTGKRLHEKGHEVLVMERGYLGDRFKYTSLGWNGLNGHATFPEYPGDRGQRFKEHGVKIKPWKKSGDYILLLGQVPTDASLKGRDIMPWYQDMARAAQQKYNLPVVFRPHPDCARKGYTLKVPGTIQTTGKTLAEDFADAKFCIAYNSNSVVDAILAGVPCIVGDKGTMAYAMASESLDELRYPPRAAWAHQLAWMQWTVEEMAGGIPLRFLLSGIK